MRKDAERVRHLFDSAGWKEVIPSEEIRQFGLTGVYACGYAVVGVVLAYRVSDVVSSWADCQLKMSDLRIDEAVGQKKDLFLVFVIQEIDVSEFADLQTIISDTHVCRKICIEQKGRTMEEALLDTPFFSIFGYRNEKDLQIPEASRELEDYGFSKHLLKALATRSASRILDQLLAGKYKRGKPNEN